MNINEQLAKEFGIRSSAIEQTVALIDEGNTIPFIARYRKEVTGGMSDVILRDLDERLKYLRGLEERKAEVIKLIEEQGKLTDELKAEIEAAEILQRVEDLYKPFKQKKTTRAGKAKAKGLEPLADIIWAQEAESGDVLDAAAAYVNTEPEVPELEVASAQDAFAGACDIIAEKIADDPDITDTIRNYTRAVAVIASEATDPEEQTVYDMYYEYAEQVAKIPDHRVLAVNRGEKEKKLKVKLNIENEAVYAKIAESVITNEKSIYHEALLETIADAYKRLMAPSLEREIRNELTERAEKSAVKVFSKNTENLLMAPPVKNARVLAIDPGYRTGCKVAALSDTGKLLAYATIYPTMPKNDIAGAERVITKLIERFNLNTVVIGNGTASRETEKFVADYIAKTGKDIKYTFVSEAGASVYSASKLASEEYPDLDVTTRGAMSIGRRLQDPLAELVKVPPRSIGVGQYQHDINQGVLDSALTGVVEDCVNRVGVDLNTASASLLSYIAGINSGIAKNIVKYREENGAFTDRKQLLKVSKLGEKTFKQCAGFMRITDAENPLDSTAVHPESYEIAERMLEKLGIDKSQISAGGAGEIEERIREVYPADGGASVAAAGAGSVGDSANENGSAARDGVAEGAAGAGESGKNGANGAAGAGESGKNGKNDKRDNSKNKGKSERQLPANGFAALAVLLEDEEFTGKKKGKNNRREERRKKQEEEREKKRLAALEKAEQQKKQAKLKKSLELMSEDLGVGVMTLTDIVDEIRKPARDPRESMPGVVFRQDVLSLEDLKEGMEMTGTVRNVVDFGAFVDIGVKTDGLVHISELSDKFIKHPMDVVSVGDVVKVRILDVDAERHKVALTMKIK